MMSDFLKRFFSGPDDPDFGGGGGDPFLIVGLGNPGRKYESTRHNIGFMAVDHIADRHHITSGRVKHKAIVGEGRIAGQRVILAKPQTFMNSSGDSVGPLANFYKVEPERVLVIYDEIDLDFGMWRMRQKGSAGGHNGMRSIIHHLGQEFPRIRLGIGRPKGKVPVKAYVLLPFSKQEGPIVEEMLDRTADAVEVMIEQSVEQAMSRYNGSVMAN